MFQTQLVMREEDHQKILAVISRLVRDANSKGIFVVDKNGSEFGRLYGLNGQGSGRMPGFGALLTDEQIEAVVEYVRSL